MEKRQSFFLITVSLVIIIVVSSCGNPSTSNDSTMFSYTSLLPDDVDIYVSILTSLSEAINQSFDHEFETWLQVAGELLIDDPVLWGRIITDSRFMLIDKVCSPESDIRTRSAMLLGKLLSAEEEYLRKRFELITIECNALASLRESESSEGISRYYSILEILSDSMYEFAGLDEYYNYSLDIIRGFLNSLSSEHFELLQFDIQDYLNRLFSTGLLAVAHYRSMILKDIRTLINDLDSLVLENQILLTREKLASIMMEIDGIIATGHEESLDELGRKASYVMTAIEKLPGEPFLRASDIADIESRLVGLQTYLNDRLVYEQRANLAETNRKAIENIKKAMENKGKTNPSPGSFLAMVDRNSISPEVDQFYWSVFSDIAKNLDTKKMEAFVSEILEGRKELP